MTQIYDWSLTASENDDADSTINWAEGQLAPTLNNSARAMMARVAAFRDMIGGVATSAGSSNAYTITSPTGHAITAYAAGLMFTFKANHTNTGAATINVDGLGAKSIKRVDGTDVGAGHIVSGGLYRLIYDGTNFQCETDPAGINDIADQTYSSGSGTYTPGSDVVGLIAFIVGGGGGGAGARTTSASNVCFGGGGGAGAVAIFFVDRASLAASYSYSVGAGGSGGSAGNGDAVGSRDGSDGGDTTFGSVTCTGGAGGTEVAESSSAVAYTGGTGGTATGGTLNLPGGNGSSGAISTAYGDIGDGGRGGSQMFGQGGEPKNGVAGQSGRGRGGGGAGAFMLPDQGGTLNRSGGAGSNGMILILELKE